MSDEEVERVLKSTTLYEVLSVEKTSSGEEIKKAYRRLAIKVHPDRCKHPKATEAFQKIAHAYQTLSDDDKRKQYDMFGDERPRPQVNPGQGFGGGPRVYRFTTGNGYQQFYDDISAEDLFRAFFGDDVFMDTGFRARPQQRRYYTPPKQEKSSWKGMMGTFALFAISLIVMIISAIPRKTANQYSEHILLEKPSEDQDYKIFTSKVYHKQFWVSKRFLIRERPNIQRNTNFYDQLKKEADQKYANNLRDKCTKEKSSRLSKRPSCDEMRKLHIT